MEFWPAMIEAVARAISPYVWPIRRCRLRSLARAKRVQALTGSHPAARAALVFVKSDRMAKRFEALGQEHIQVLGETRFDIPPPVHQLAAADVLRATLSRPVLTVASVVAREEETYLAALKPMTVCPLTLWVPCAPELFETTTARLRAADFKFAQRSDTFDDDLNLTWTLEGIDILVGDSFGEMFFYMQPASADVVGVGSVEKGVHHAIDPLALSKPVITGPHILTIEYTGVEAQGAGVLKVCETAAD